MSLIEVLAASLFDLRLVGVLAAFKIDVGTGDPVLFVIAHEAGSVTPTIGVVRNLCSIDEDSHLSSMSV